MNDQGRPFTREIAVAKYFAGEAVVKAAGLAMEIHGGMGYSLELPVEKYYRDSKLYQIGEGTANIMRLLIADDALGIKRPTESGFMCPVNSDYKGPTESAAMLQFKNRRITCIVISLKNCWRLWQR